MDGGQNVSERLGFASMTNKRVVLCNTLQDPKVEQVIRFSQDLKMWRTEAIEKVRVQRPKHPERPHHHKEPKPTLLGLKQLKDLGPTAIPSDKESWL